MLWEWIIDIAGWMGSLEVVVAYFLVSYNRISADSRVYQWLNLTGSVFLLANTIYYGAFPSAFVNLVWGFIAIASLYRIINQQPKSDALR